MDEAIDPDGHSFFLLPRNVGAVEAREAALKTYLLNAGTGYGRVGVGSDRPADFPAAPYSVDEVQRVAARQRANRWSYDAVRIIATTGGRLVTTPHGVLMGAPGNRVHGQFSRRGGTMWGDVFLINVTPGCDPASRLRQIIESGRFGVDGPALDRLLHHEEIHAQQWAERGVARMICDYSWELLRESVLGRPNRLEAAAGLADGGYR